MALLRYLVLVVLGVGVVCTRVIRRHPVPFTCLVIVALAVGAASAGNTERAPRSTQAVLVARIAALERACVPRYTGGGVTQCAQPSVPEARLRAALRACMSDAEYVGGTLEDTFVLRGRCVDDWMDAHATP